MSKITNQQTLQMEIARLKKECLVREQKLNDRFDHLQNNAGSILVDTLLPSSGKSESGFFSGLTDGLFSSLGKISSSPVTKELLKTGLTSLGVFLIRKIFKK